MSKYPPEPHPRFTPTDLKTPFDHDSPLLQDLVTDIDSIIGDIDLNYGRLSYRNPDITPYLKEISEDLKCKKAKLQKMMNTNQQEESSGFSPSEKAFQ